MSVTQQVRQSETGQVRVYALDLAPNEARALTPDTIAPLLGQTALDAAHVEIFDLEDIAELGLIAYLADGHGIERAELDASAPQLNALKGAVVLLRSSAITTRPTTLTPQAPLRWIATFGEVPAPVPRHQDIESDAAKGILTGPPATGPAPRINLPAMLVALALTAIVALTLAYALG